MSSVTSLTRIALAVSLAVGAGSLGAAVAAEDGSPPKSSNTAAKDYGRLSIDGSHAFSEIGLARLAIYDGKPAIAGRLVADARTLLMRARSDDAVYMKAETALRPPKNAGATVPPPPADATPKAWLPVDGVFAIDETLEPTPDKARAVQAANQHMRNGEPDKARDALKVANIDADYTLEVAPLGQSMADVNRAAQLMAGKDYYNASQALRQAQDGVRYDTISFDDVPGAHGRSAVAAASNGLPAAPVTASSAPASPATTPPESAHSAPTASNATH